jgi:renalase
MHVKVKSIIKSPINKMTPSLALHVAVVGGGITGASVASTLASLAPNVIKVDLFDQGRSGVGGRTSHRVVSPQAMQWDHGCQFFRADTPRFQAMVQDWIKRGIAAEWTGDFRSDSPGADFFGLPTQPPFYVGVGGMRSIPEQLLKQAGTSVTVFSGHRVATMERRVDQKWNLFGTTGDAAYHDSSETVARSTQPSPLGHAAGYDAVVLTDVSSSFDPWHRASAGVPLEFAARVRAAAGARVPLFTCMLAFETPIPISTSAASFSKNERLWFAARSRSKAGLSHLVDCWTLVSTPEFAIQKIKDAPMQDPMTGEFIPQSSDYLTTVPGPELEEAFRQLLVSGVLGTVAEEDLPETVYLGAQRWGSAMPAHRDLNEHSLTRQVLSGVAYDSGKGSLAPTTKVTDTRHNFIADDDQMLFQAGDMVSMYTPGFEGAALSGIDLGEYLVTLLANKKT